MGLKKWCKSSKKLYDKVRKRTTDGKRVRVIVTNQSKLIGSVKWKRKKGKKGKQINEKCTSILQSSKADGLKNRFSIRSASNKVESLESFKLIQQQQQPQQPYQSPTILPDQDIVIMHDVYELFTIFTLNDFRACRLQCGTHQIWMLLECTFLAGVHNTRYAFV